MISENAQKALDDLGNYSALFGASNSEVEEDIAEEAKDWLVDYIASLELQLSEARARLAWIPVSERLPEDGESVLVADHGNVFVDYRYENGMVVGVTHWMPLPKAPKEEE